jgi:hypothetical protein
VNVFDAHDFVDSGRDEAQSINVEDVAPTLVSYDMSDTPSLIAGSYDTVDFTALIEDDNGDGGFYGADGYFYDASAVALTSGYCDESELNCYYDSVCTINTSAGTASQARLECSIPVWFNANASANWESHVNVSDSGGRHVGFADSDADVNIPTLSGVNVSADAFNYGTLDVGQVSLEQSFLVENAGNQVNDISIQGTDMASGSDSIARANQEWSETTGFVHGTGNELVETATSTGASAGCLDADLAVRTTHSIGTGSDAPLYWRIRIPDNTPFGTYIGEIQVGTITCD